jgi:hypothetical protein
MMNYVVEALDRNFDNVILGIIHDAEERDPIRLYLASQIQRGDLDFRLGRVETFRDLIEKDDHSDLSSLRVTSSHLHISSCPAQVRGALRPRPSCCCARKASQSARLSWHYRAWHNRP